MAIKTSILRPLPLFFLDRKANFHIVRSATALHFANPAIKNGFWFLRLHFYR
jgi:hypothetical protein